MMNNVNSKMTKLFHLFLIITILATAIDAARILAVIPTVSKSHYASSRNILLALAKRHEVVVISPYEEKNPPQGWSWIHMEIKNFEEAVPITDPSARVKEVTFFAAQHRLWESMNTYSDYVTNLTTIKNFIQKDTSHFDLIFMEDFFQQAFYTFAYKYNAPMVLLCSFGSAHYINEYLGNALETSYVPHEFASFFGEMSLGERARNLVYTIFDVLGRKYYSLEYQNDVSKRVFGLPNAPHVGDIEREAALILVNAHFSINVVKPLLPNMVEIAGVHIDEVKPLDQELKSILDNAKDGAVLFSFGSIVELPQLPKEIVVPIFKALGRLKQEVLVKWNSDSAPPLAFGNVHTFKWLPQNDIMAHPNLKAFITHGGLMSSQEAIHHGVPSICIPFFGDQTLNCQRSVKLGFGLHVSRQDLTEDVLFDSLQELLTVERYRETVGELSRRFKDRPVPAIDTAIYWIEYVLRHNGAEFLKGPKRNMYWFQALHLDLFALFLVTFLFVRKVVRKAFEIYVGNTKVKTS